MRHGFRHTRSQRWRRHASAKTIGTIPRKNEERYNMRNGLFHLATGATLAIALSASSAYAQKKYDTGASDTEIKIGRSEERRVGKEWSTRLRREHFKRNRG